MNGEKLGRVRKSNSEVDESPRKFTTVAVKMYSVLPASAPASIVNYHDGS